MKTLYAQNTDLTRDKRFSFLTEDVVATGTTFRIQSILGFQNLDTSSGQIVLIGDIGMERSEILRTSNSTAPSQSYKEITLRDTLNFDHPQDTKVYIVDWNRADFEWSATTGGTKSTLVAYPVQVQPDQEKTLFNDTSQTTGYYFIRFNETIGNTNSDWSDPVPFGNYDDNTVFMIKKRALDQSGEVIDGQIITHEYLDQCLWEARREYHNSMGKRPFRRKFNFVLGTALTGSFRIELPTDVEKPWTAENIYNVKIGTNTDMGYYDKRSWDFDYRNIAHSTLDVPYTRGTSTSIWLANGRDFGASPVISVEGMNIGLSRITGENNSFKIITHGSYSSASGGSDAWLNVSLGLPSKFTVWADPGGSAYVYFNRPLDTAYAGVNIYADYYSTPLTVNSDADTVDEPDYNMFSDYLAYKIKERKSRGQIPVGHLRSGQVYIADADFQSWMRKKQEALAQEYLATEIRIVPDVPPNFPYY